VLQVVYTLIILQLIYLHTVFMDDACDGRNTAQIDIDRCWALSTITRCSRSLVSADQLTDSQTHCTMMRRRWGARHPHVMWTTRLWRGFS